MDKTARELHKLIAAIPKTDRGFSWELRDYHGNERLEVYGAIAKAFMYILDNTDAILSTLKPEGEQISGEPAPYGWVIVVAGIHHFYRDEKTALERSQYIGSPAIPLYRSQVAS